MGVVPLKLTNSELDGQFLTACRKGRLEDVQALVERGAQLYITNKDGATPIIQAGANPDRSVVRWLHSKGGYSLAETARSWGVIHSCAVKGDVEFLGLCLDEGVDINSPADARNTPLHYSCVHSHGEAVRLLIRRGADVNALDSCMQTPLHRISTPEAGLHELLAAGADIEAKTKFGDSPLALAALEGRLSVIKELLALGANIESRSNDGGTVLLAAAKFNRVEAVALLLEAGADSEAKNTRGSTLASLARSRPELKAFLRAYQVRQAMLAVAAKSRLIGASM